MSHSVQYTRIRMVSTCRFIKFRTAWSRKWRTV